MPAAVTTPASSPPSSRRSLLDIGAPVDVAPLNVRKTSPAGNSARVADKTLPPAPPHDSTKTSRASLERRRSSRPQSTARKGSGDSLPRGKNGKGIGPKLPVKVSPMMSMADMRNGMRLPDDEDDDAVTPGESSDAFEDAAESVKAPSRSPSRSSSIGISEEITVVGLGINGGANRTNGHRKAETEAGERAKENKEAEDGNADVKPKMSARLSRWISDDPVMFAGEVSPPLHMPSHSRQVTAEKVPAQQQGSNAADAGAAVDKEEGDAGSAHVEQAVAAAAESSDQTATVPAHSRQNTAEAAPSLVAIPRPVSPEEANGMRADTASSPPPSHSRQATLDTAPALVSPSLASAEVDSDSGRRSRSHSRQATAESAPTLTRQAPTPNDDPAVSLANIRAGLQSHSRQATAEAIPVLLPPEPERSVSPIKSLSRSESPTFVARGLPGDVSLPSPPPPSSLGRIQALEQRSIGDRPALGSPSGGLMRSASTRMGQFLGRMGSMRKPARSPPGPRSDSRSAYERRHTAQSIASVTSLGAESLATISDSPEGANGSRPSLQDQFQNLRKQSEYSCIESNGQIDEGDEEGAEIGRTRSDAGAVDSTDVSSGISDARSQRALSTPNILRSPPMNPSLPPGTASGLDAGPAEQPRPVDWDLWQAVVYEGPSAVQKSSGEELNEAIASGIPPAIRGVVWQVLAESKNAELENVYRTLKSRGSPEGDLTGQDASRPQSLSRTGSQANVNDSADRDEAEYEVSSSRASIHSEKSTPATSNLASPPLSVKGDEQELKLKLFAEKQKREAAALAKLEKAIKRDLGSRTSFSKYTQAAGLQDGLFGVCKAYALFDEGVGYAQGINFIAMPLLFNMAEEEAFTLLVRLMSKYDLRSMFTGDMAGLHLRLYQFERLLEEYEPALYCHLRRRNVGPQLYATQWFLTLFAYRFPLQLVLRVYDLVLSEGLTAILKFGLVLMAHNRDALLAMRDMSHLTTFLKEKLFDVYIDKSPSASSLLDSGFFGSVTGGADKELYRAEEMVRDACDVKIAESTLAQYTAEWEESQRQTHEREAELENLRTTNASLSAKIKGLEERTLQQDSEHVNMAGDLVRVKVENDSLADENEGLKVKVEELQKLVDGQPAELEAKLKDEMDRILQRNSEVQSENRVLKEEMEEMEHELVNVKLLHAQTQTDYDALIQKWSNIQTMLSDK